MTYWYTIRASVGTVSSARACATSKACPIPELFFNFQLTLETRLESIRLPGIFFDWLGVSF